MVPPGARRFGLVAVVAVASGGSTSTRPGRARWQPSTTLLDALFTLGVMAVLAGTAMFAYGLTQRKAIAAEIATGRYRRGTLMAWMAFVVLNTAFIYWRVRDWERAPTEESAVSDVSGPGTGLSPLPTGAASAYEPGISWIPIAVVVVLALAATTAYVVLRLRSKPKRNADEPSGGARLGARRRARRPPIGVRPAPCDHAAYARLERVLAAHGVPAARIETADGIRRGCSGNSTSTRGDRAPDDALHARLSSRITTWTMR